MNKLKRKKARITKIVDLVYQENHPNGINPGYIKEGIIIMEPKEGFSFVMEDFHTSRIEEIEEYKENIYMLHTRNSMYKLEILE